MALRLLLTLQGTPVLIGFDRLIGNLKLFRIDKVGNSLKFNGATLNWDLWVKVDRDGVSSFRFRVSGISSDNAIDEFYFPKL